MSNDELCNQFKVSKSVLQRVLDKLEFAKFIYRHTFRVFDSGKYVSYRSIYLNSERFIYMKKAGLIKIETYKEY